MRIKDRICYEDFDVLSLDFYDTLVNRDVKTPKQVFDIVSECFKKRYGVYLEEFAKHRAQAECKARDILKHEVTLNDIYGAFSNSYSLIDRIRLAEIEIYVEKHICIPNPEVLEILNCAKSLGKKVIIISDFYIGESFIESVLNKYNISVDNIFVSCDVGRTKFVGDIYQFIADKLNVESNRVLHIGDNYNSDYQNARKNGFRSIWYERKVDEKDHYNFYNYTTVHNDYVDCYISNRIGSFSKGIDYSDGYSVMGPLLFGFCNWLHSKVKNEGIDKVFFLSRDGKIIKAAFDILFDDVETYYLYASRRALQVPTLSVAANINEALNCVYLGERITVEKLFLKLGMDEYWIKAFCEKHCIDMKQLIDVNELKQNDEIKISLFDESFAEIRENAEKEKRQYFNYLHQIGFSGKVAIVDIGWFGSMQNALLSMSEGNVDIFGYYIGVDPFAKRQKTLHMEGYLFDANHNDIVRRNQLKFNAVFELIFSANHGSVIKIDKEVNPVFKKNENLYNWETLGDFQEGALSFVRDFNNESIIREMELSFIINRIFDFFIYPRVDVAIKWSTMIFDDYGHTSINRINGINYYRFHPIKFLKDYKESMWKFGFITANLEKQYRFYKYEIIKDWIKEKLKRNDL